MGAGVTRARRAGPDAGFSLIELMVVVAILATVSVAAVLAVGRPAATGAAGDAAALQRAFDLQQGLAIRSGLRRGLLLERDGMTLARWSDGAWQADTSLHRWRARPQWRLPAGVSVGSAPAPDSPPQVVLLPNGQSTAFEVRFARRGSVVRCTTDGWTGLTCAGA